MPLILGPALDAHTLDRTGDRAVLEPGDLTRQADRRSATWYRRAGVIIVTRTRTRLVADRLVRIGELDAGADAGCGVTAADQERSGALKTHCAWRPTIQPLDR